MKSMRLQQGGVVALLFAGYGALYFCRADLSVGAPLIVDQLARQGMSHDQAVVRIGTIASLGVLAYALGKLFLGGLGDHWGGRTSFLIGLGGATIFTLQFAAGGGVPVFMTAWFGNRLTQSVAWAGLIKVSSRWFDYSSYGLIIGILSLSYLVGDAAARGSMGALIERGCSWRVLFCYAAGVTALCFAANWFLLRESRSTAGFTEAQTNPLNLFAASQDPQRGLKGLLGPLLASRAFVLVCLLSLGCTIIRETFNIWTPVYLRDFLGYTTAGAAGTSAVFPAVGAASVLLSGWLSDRLGPNGRALLLCLGLGVTAAALVALMLLRPGGSHPALPLVGIGVVAFCLLGPYSYLGGAFALDFGGKQASAMSSGIIDGVGYLGAVAAGDSVARISVAAGWQGVFITLAGVSALATVGAGWLYRMGAKAARRGTPLP